MGSFIDESTDRELLELLPLLEEVEEVEDVRNYVGLNYNAFRSR